MTTAPPVRTRPAKMAATVIRSVKLSPTMTRVVLGGPGLQHFQAGEAADSYVKLSFVVPGVDWPVVRTYTVRSWNEAAGELSIDFVVHGHAGVAGPWAAAAEPEDQVLVAGPGGGYSPNPAADHHLFIGDESALPAIAAALERLPRTAVGQALIEVPDTGSAFPLLAPPGVELRWIVARDGSVGGALVAAARTLELPSGTIDAFVHGEAGFVKELRRQLRVDRGLPREQLSISGYWRIGATEEGWRAAKAEWNRQAEDVEAAAGLS